MDTQALWREFKRTEDPVRAKALRDRLILTYAPLVKYVAGRLGAVCRRTWRRETSSPTACSG